MPVPRRQTVLVVAFLIGVTVGLTFWLSHRAGAQPAPSTGQTLWNQDCAVCHGPRGEGSFRGPRISDRGQAAISFMVSTGRMPISAPRTDVPRSKPKYTPEQIDALLRYTQQFVTGPPIPTVDLTGADVAAGGTSYRLNCASCHQSVGAGGALAYGAIAPPLHDSTPVQVVEAMRVGPGTMPVFDPNQIDDAEAKNIAAYVDYLRAPKDRGGYPLGHLGPVPEGLIAWVVGLGLLLLFVRWLGTRDRIPSE